MFPTKSGESNCEEDVPMPHLKKYGWTADAHEERDVLFVDEVLRARVDGVWEAHVVNAEALWGRMGVRAEVVERRKVRELRALQWE